MADKSWMKPGVECWAWGFNAPMRVWLVGTDGEGRWAFTRKRGGEYDGSTGDDYIYQTELEAQRAWMEDDLADIKILEARIAKTRARIAELEANDG